MNKSALLLDRAIGRRLVRTGGHSLIQRATKRMDSVTVPTADERRAAWAARYYALGMHRCMNRIHEGG